MRRPPPLPSLCSLPRRPRAWLLAAALALASHPAAAQSGGGYDLGWSAMGVGGGVTAGGGFQLAGTLSPGQAGHASGGSFVLEGGWGGVVAAVGTPPAPAIPARFALLAPEPNPFSRATTIRLDLPQAVDVRLAVFDLRGRRVREVAAGVLAPGRHAVEWNGVDGAGVRLPSGMYFVRLDAGAFHATSRLVLVH